MSNEPVKVIALSNKELQEVKRVASDDALFKSTMLVETKIMTKKVDIINGTVGRHEARWNGNKVAHVFYNMFMGACITGTAIMVRCLFVVWGKVEALACLITK